MCSAKRPIKRTVVTVVGGLRYTEMAGLGEVAVVCSGSGNSAGRGLEVQASTVPWKQLEAPSEWKEVVGNRIIESRKKPHDIESQATD